MNKLTANKKVRLYGAGGHSQVIRDVLEINGYEVSKIFDDHPENKHHTLEKVDQGLENNRQSFSKGTDPIIIAIGNNCERAKVASKIDCDFYNAIHQSAVIAKSVTIGEGSVVFAGAVIQPNTKIGKHVIINTSSSVDHDNIIEDFVHISPNVALCGNVEIGEGTHVGAGAVVIPSVKIGKWCTVGAGAVIIKDVPDNSVVVGNPGKIIKKNNVKKQLSKKKIFQTVIESLNY